MLCILVGSQGMTILSLTLSEREIKGVLKIIGKFLTAYLWPINYKIPSKQQGTLYSTVCYLTSKIIDCNAKYKAVKMPKAGMDEYLNSLNMIQQTKIRSWLTKMTKYGKSMARAAKFCLNIILQSRTLGSHANRH